MPPNPWLRLAEDWPHVDVQFDSDLGVTWAETRWCRSGRVYIALNSTLTQVQRRVSIAHEIEHLDRGAPCHTLKASIEQRVVNATAKYLLPDVEVLAGALAVYDMRRAADELWVTFPVLLDRLKTLSNEELDYVAGRRGESVA